MTSSHDYWSSCCEHLAARTSRASTLMPLHGIFHKFCETILKIRGEILAQKIVGETSFSKKQILNHIPIPFLLNFFFEVKCKTHMHEHKQWDTSNMTSLYSFTVSPVEGAGWAMLY